MAIMLFSILLLINTLSVFAQNNAHPCKRECIEGERRTCKYDFLVETYYSLDIHACYNCPDVLEDCFRKDCIVGGGIKKNVVVINRSLPGPPIEVCLGDTIEVNVENILLNDESTTFHWHGQHVKQTPYMDGVPWVTQCPIFSNNNFTYRIIAEVSGTHFWHSHTKMQRGDGAFGSLIVHVPDESNPHRGLYDYDLTEHQVIVTDWTNSMRVEAYGSFAHGGNLPAPDGILINGLGYMNLQNIDLRLPLATFKVDQGKRYRLRFINAEFFDCPMSISIDNHTFTIISADGYDVQPKTVDTFMIFAGERYDVIVEANQEPDLYWIRVKGFEMCQLYNLYQVAVLQYNGAPEKRFPSAPRPNYETALNPGLIFNPLLGNEENAVLVSELQAVEEMDPLLETEPVVRHYFKLSFNPVNNPTIYRYPYYGFNNVSRANKIPTPMINDIGYSDPDLPLLPYRNEISESTFCTNHTEYKKDCVNNYCHCPQIVKLPLNRVIELVVFDVASRSAHHPMHLHGYGFRVIAWEKLGNTTSISEIESLDQQGLIKRNFDNPSRRDTIPVPLGGYTILRFRTDNPGFWIFHCHVDIHTDDGMRMVFKMGENNEMKRAPRRFPQCGNYPR